MPSLRTDDSVRISRAPPFIREQLSAVDRTRYNQWFNTAQKVQSYTFAVAFTTLLAMPFVPVNICAGVLMPFVYCCSEAVIVSGNVQQLYSSIEVRFFAKMSENNMKNIVTHHAPLSSWILPCFIGNNYTDYFFPST